jgi:hypothetical protein
MVLFVVAQVLSALAPSYGTLMTGRIVASFAHGAHIGIASVVAAELAGHHEDVATPIDHAWLMLCAPGERPPTVRAWFRSHNCLASLPWRWPSS